MPGWSHLEGGEWPWYTRLLATLGLGRRLAYFELLATVDEDLRLQHSINRRRLRDELHRSSPHPHYLEEQVVRYREIEDNDWYTLDTVDP